MCHLDWAACLARRPGVTLIETTLSARRSQFQYPVPGWQQPERRPKGRRSHEGMCRGAVAMTRTTASGPASKDRDASQRCWIRSRTSVGGFSAFMPIPNIGGRHRAAPFGLGP
jgi:hypothetical protein